MLRGFAHRRRGSRRDGGSRPWLTRGIKVLRPIYPKIVPGPIWLSVEMEKIEQEEDQRRRVGAVRSELDDVERGDAVGTDAAQFAVEIGLPRIERRHGFGDRRIFVRPVEPRAC